MGRNVSLSAHQRSKLNVKVAIEWFIVHGLETSRALTVFAVKRGEVISQSGLCKVSSRVFFACVLMHVKNNRQGSAH